MTYDAFVSYSRAVDGRLAPALQTALQRFAKPWYRLRALRVFRDDASLAANPALWASIEEALARSRWFVLLASPTAAGSRWVRREVDWWLEHHGTERLLVAVTDGDVTWDEQARRFADGPQAALPPALRGAFAEEPRYTDLRFARTADHLSTSDARFRDAVADLAAAVHGRAKDDMVGEDVRQHRRAVRLARAAGATLLVLAAASALAAVLAVQGRNEAREQRNEAVAQERSSRSRELAANALLNLSADPSLSLLLAIEAAETEPTPEAENALRQALLEPQPTAVLAGHDDAVGDVALSADATQVATSSADRTARLWDAATGEPLAVFRGHRRDVSGVELTPDGERLLTWAQDGTARIWDARRGTPLGTLRDDPDGSGRMTDATFGAGGGLVATASFLGGYVAVWDAATGRRVSTLELAGESVVDDVDFTPDGERAVGVLQDGTTQLWEVRTGRTLAVLAGHETYVWAVDVSRDGRLAVDASEDGTAVVWDLRTRARVAVLGRRGGTPLTGAFFAPDASLVLTTAQDGTAGLWRVRGGVPRAELAGHEDTINDAAFSGEGTVVVTGSEDGTARVSDVATGRSIAHLRGHRGAVAAVAVAADGRLVATAGADGTARLWDPAGGEPVRTITLPVEPAVVSDVAVTTDGERLLASGGGRAWAWNASTGELAANLGDAEGLGASFSPDGDRAALVGEGRVTVWDVAASEAVAELPHPEGGAEVVWARTGGLAALASPDGTVQVWETASATAVATVEHGDFLSSLAFAPDGATLATAGRDGHVRLWEARTGRRLLDLVAHVGRSPDGFEYVADTAEVTPDGKLLVTAGDDGAVRVWDAATGQERLAIDAHPPVQPRYIEGVVATVSPDGRRIASAAQWEPVARVWSVSDGGLVAELAGHAGGLSGIAFSPDGRFVLTTSYDGTARVWDPESGRAVLVIRPLRPGGPAQDLAPSAAFAPDGRSVLGGSGETLRLYRCEICAPLADLLSIARDRVARELTEAERRRYLAPAAER